MCITQWIYLFIILFRSSIRRKRMSFFAFASIYDISRDRFCRRDVRNLHAKNARCDALMRHCALLRTIRRRSCERSFLRLHRHLQRRLQFRLIWHFLLSFRSHHFVSFFIAYRLIRNTRHEFYFVSHAMNQSIVNSFITTKLSKIFIECFLSSNFTIIE